MLRVRVLVSVVAVALLTGGWLSGQDEKKDAEAKAKGILPQNWKQLGLTDEQRQKVYKTQEDYRVKIDKLQGEINKLKKQERTDLEKVLTDAQKARLREILASKAPDTPEKDDKKPDKKP